MADIHEQAAEAAIRAHNAHRELSEEQLRQLRQQPDTRPVRNYPLWFEAPGCALAALVVLLGIPALALVALIILASGGIVRPAVASASSTASSWTTVQKTVAEMNLSGIQVSGPRGGTIEFSAVAANDVGVDHRSAHMGQCPCEGYQMSTGYLLVDHGIPVWLNADGTRLFR